MKKRTCCTVCGQAHKSIQTGHVFFFSRSVQLAPAAIVALVQNIDIVLGFVIDIVFFTHEWPGTLKTVGICLIFIGVLSVAFAKLYRHKKHAPIDD